MQPKWRTEAVQLILIGGMFGVSAILWPWAPDRFTVHWNLAGVPDRFGGKFEGLLLEPIVALSLYLMFLVLPWIDPCRTAYAAFWHGYTMIRVATICLIAGIHALVLLTAFGYQVDVKLLVPLGVGLLFCVVGNFMGKFRPNWFVGVRTPWTLSSPTSWNKTNRLGGRLFIVTGLALCLFAFLHNVWTLMVVLALIAVMVVWLPTYSYLVWRRDPDRLGSNISST